MFGGDAHPGNTGPRDYVRVTVVRKRNVRNGDKEQHQNEDDQVQEKQPAEEYKIGHYAGTLVTCNVQ